MVQFVKPWCTTIPVLIFALCLIACGGGSSNGSSGSTGAVTPPSSGGTPSNGPSGSLPSPVAVTVSAGSTTSGIGITVPTGTPPLNAEVLGVTPVHTSGGSVSNTGGVVQLGSIASVLLFGKGLDGNLTVSVFGPNDLTISNIQGIKSTTGTPGVQFDISVNSNATPGARTVVLHDASGNVTTFTGGLEIQ